MQKSKNNAYNPKEKGPLLARSISQTGAFNYTRFFFPLTFVENEYSKLYNEDTKRTRIHSMNGSDFIGIKAAASRPNYYCGCFYYAR